jgi:hypothetical protein
MESSESRQGPQVIILLGSRSDMEHRAAIARGLDRFEVTHETRIASAHRVTRYLLDILDSYERDGRSHVYITVAGRSNALSGVIDANSRHPVIACPPYGERFAGMDLLGAYAGRGGANARAGAGSGGARGGKDPGRGRSRARPAHRGLAGRIARAGDGRRSRGSPRITTYGATLRDDARCPGTMLAVRAVSDAKGHPTPHANV